MYGSILLTHDTSKPIVSAKVNGSDSIEYGMGCWFVNNASFIEIYIRDPGCCKFRLNAVLNTRLRPTFCCFTHQTPRFIIDSITAKLTISRSSWESLPYAQRGWQRESSSQLMLKLEDEVCRKRKTRNTYSIFPENCVSGCKGSPLSPHVPSTENGKLGCR
jgi:hypothetical protein